MAKKFVAKFDASIVIIIIFIYHIRTEHKIQKLNSVNESMEGYQRSYSSLNWPPMLINKTTDLARLEPSKAFFKSTQLH